MLKDPLSSEDKGNNTVHPDGIDIISLITPSSDNEDSEDDESTKDVKYNQRRNEWLGEAKR